MSIYIGFWTMKVRCTQYEFCGQVTFQEYKNNFSLKSAEMDNIFPIRFQNFKNNNNKKIKNKNRQEIVQRLLWVISHSPYLSLEVRRGRFNVHPSFLPTRVGLPSALRTNRTSPRGPMAGVGWSACQSTTVISLGMPSFPPWQWAGPRCWLWGIWV